MATPVDPPADRSILTPAPPTPAGPAPPTPAAPAAPTSGPAQQLLGARPTPYGAPAAVEGMGGIVAPLLAGFSLALLGLVIQAEDDLRWPNLALLLLSVAIVLLVLVVQFAFRARQYAATPSQAKDWWPDFDHNPERQQRVYEELSVYLACHRWWTTRARALYNTAIGVLLLGLAVVLVPKHPIGPLRAAAIAAVLAGLVMEVLLLVGGWLLAPPRAGLRERLPGWVARLAWWLASGNPLVKPGR
jgi:hypothetical protein